MTIKEQVINAVEEIPYDASIEDAMEKLYLLYKIERGIQQAALGQKVSQKEAKNEFNFYWHD